MRFGLKKSVCLVSRLGVSEEVIAITQLRRGASKYIKRGALDFYIVLRKEN